MTLTLDQAARQLQSHADYRVLRRVPPVERWELAEAQGDVVRAAIVDSETTGLADDDEVIELAVLPFDYCRTTSRVVRVHTDRALSAFREPTKPIPPESARVHGITPEMVAGHSITDEQVAAAMDGVQLVIAHHAGFDRPHLEAHWKRFEDVAWACSYANMDWKAEGIGSSKLDYILMSLGWFHCGHRALEDATSTLFALNQPLPSGRTGLATLLEHARRPLFIIRAEFTLFDQRGLLKARGYEWQDGKQNGMPKAWALATDDPNKEIEWLRQSEAWVPSSKVVVFAVSPKLRYSSRLYEAKGAA